MKVALITDQHFGARGDSPQIADHQEKFYREVFFPYLDANGIHDVVDLGDTFDRRKYTNHLSLDRAKKMFFDPILEREINLTIIVGNHDIYHKDRLDPNSVELFLAGNYNFNIVTEPYETTFGAETVILMPWICDSNRKKAYELMERSKAQVLFGHLELKGFEMYRGLPQENGDDPLDFQKFALVCSGHYHHKSTYGNINYLGCPYEMTWSDWDDQKGFHVFDTETRSIEFVPNPYRLHHKLEWTGLSADFVGSYGNYDLKDLEGAFVKVVVRERGDEGVFDEFLKAAEDIAENVQVIDGLEKTELKENEEALESEDTLSLVRRYIDQQDLGAPSEAVYGLVRDLYEEASQG